MTFFSVIIPTYNSKVSLVSAINSVLRQSYTDYEVIVVDDCSGDDTKLALLEFVDNLDRFYFYRLDSNLGAAAARNFGISQAKGEWIAFLDADDRWSEAKLGTVFEAIESQPDVGLVYSASKVVDQAGLAVRTIGVGCSNNAARETLIYNKIGGSSRVVVKKTFFDSGSFDFDTTLDSCEDWDLWIRLSKVAKVKALSNELVDYIENSSSLSSNKFASENGWAQLFEKHRDSYVGFEQKFFFRKASFFRNRGLYQGYLRSIFSTFRYIDQGVVIPFVLVCSIFFPLSYLRHIYTWFKGI